MKKILLTLFLFIFFSGLNATKYAGEIFHFGAGVRNFALGNCGLTDENSFAVGYWNSALLPKIINDRFELLHAEEFMGMLKYDTASAIWGQKTKFSIIITRIGLNNIPLTKLEDPDEDISSNNRPYKYKEINNSDIVGYFGFSRKVGKFQLGFTPKFAYRTLAENSGFGFGADVSVFFQLKKNLFFACKLRDFFSTQILWSNGTHEIVNPGFDTEFRYDVTLPIVQKLSKIYFRTEFFAESRKEAAQLSLSILSLDSHFGLETSLTKNLDILFGYDIQNFTSGISIHLNNLLINYSLELNSELENSHRISLGLTL